MFWEDGKEKEGFLKVAEGVLLREGDRAVCVPPELDGRDARGSGADFVFFSVFYIPFFLAYFAFFVSLLSSRYVKQLLLFIMKQLLFFLFERDDVTYIM